MKPAIMVSIAKAESGLDPYQKNAISSASGIFQFTNGTFKHFCIEEYKITSNMDYKNYPLVQAKCAAEMIVNGHIDAWNASRSVWKKLIEVT